MNQVLAALDGYDVYSSTQIGRDESASLQKEMTVILAIAAVVIVVVLLFTSKSYMEVPVYLIVFVVAAVLNMGTNFIFGTISFITNSIAVVFSWPWPSTTPSFSVTGTWRSGTMGWIPGRRTLPP